MTTSFCWCYPKEFYLLCQSHYFMGWLANIMGLIERTKIRLLKNHMENQRITVSNCVYYTKNFSYHFIRSYWWSARHSQCEGKKDYDYLLCLLPLQRKSDLSSANVGFLSFFSATVNLHITHKTFTLTYPSIGKSKFNAHLR